VAPHDRAHRGAEVIVAGPVGHHMDVFDVELNVAEMTALKAVDQGEGAAVDSDVAVR
jgi:hypothetical protein